MAGALLAGPPARHSQRGPLQPPAHRLRQLHLGLVGPGRAASPFAGLSHGPCACGAPLQRGRGSRGRTTRLTTGGSRGKTRKRHPSAHRTSPGAGLAWRPSEVGTHEGAANQSASAATALGNERAPLLLRLEHGQQKEPNRRWGGGGRPRDLVMCDAFVPAASNRSLPFPPLAENGADTATGSVTRKKCAPPPSPSPSSAPLPRRVPATSFRRAGRRAWPRTRSYGRYSVFSMGASIRLSA